MAFRSTGYWKWLTSRLRGNAHATSTSPKRQVYAGPAADFGYLDLVEEVRKTSVKADFTYTGLLKAPNVRVKKKLRETIPVVVVPDKVVDEGKKFVEKSFYRKAAHVQEFEIGIQYMPNPICKDVYAHPLKAETLKSVGIEPQQL
ncbi:hypothetical protein POPTR_012G110900v4 [Populus trichocarpa]|uniref:Uncharacterized protein n=1 Tax=Populus trichocarpa TaxID=3694 RepID=A0ACC0S5M3_POPTR|nr:hypothetical protein POPTR_012G110900v4 [Populus trichocarpa]